MSCDVGAPDGIVRTCDQLEDTGGSACKVDGIDLEDHGFGCHCGGCECEGKGRAACRRIPIYMMKGKKSYCTLYLCPLKHLSSDSAPNHSRAYYTPRFSFNQAVADTLARVACRA